jgi:hypothetical protein
VQWGQALQEQQVQQVLLAGMCGWVLAHPLARALEIL